VRGHTMMLGVEHQSWHVKRTSSRLTAKRPTDLHADANSWQVMMWLRPGTLIGSAAARECSGSQHIVHAPPDDEKTLNKVTFTGSDGTESSSLTQSTMETYTTVLTECGR